MSLWTEQMHEEHFKDLLRAAEQSHIAHQQKERQRKNHKSQRRVMIWVGPFLSVFGKQLQEYIINIVVYLKDKGGVL
jgi:hypothetical protein